MTITQNSSKGLNIALWAAQILLAAAFGLFGSMKATQPLDQIGEMMKWVPTMAPMFVRTLGTLEVLGAIGLILPSLTRIMPKLTVAAALCFIILQVFAIGLHVSRGEFEALPLNAVLIAIAAFVFWGRSGKAIIAPRG
jgi:uncharacterized membrane protein